MAEPLSASDLSAIQAERGPVLMHVGGVMVLGGRRRHALTLDPVDAARQARSEVAVLTELARGRPEAPATWLNTSTGRRRVCAVALRHRARAGTYG